MKKNIYKKIQTHISIHMILLSCICVMTGLYMICVYKTVTVASFHEKERRLLSELQTVLGEKEHIYIQKTAEINIEHAQVLGYEKAKTETIAYMHTEEEKALAIRY